LFESPKGLSSSRLGFDHQLPQKESGGEILIRMYSLFTIKRSLQELNFKCDLHHQEDDFICMIMFKCQEYSVMVV
jgi:hypothetical protein